MEAAPQHGSSIGSPLTVYDDPATYRALIWTPPAASGPLPVLIHLHGAGEAGDDTWGIVMPGQTCTPLVELHFGRAHPALSGQFCVVGPQSPTSRWDDAKVSAFASQLIEHPPPGVAVDPCRVYIAGHSNGATASLNAGGRGLRVGGSPKRFAAIVPVAPGGCSQPERLKGVPVWLFHAVNDAVLPVHCADAIAAALREVDGAQAAELVRYTRYDEAPPPPGYPALAGHGSPIPAWATEGLWEWLLSKRAA